MSERIKAWHFCAEDRKLGYGDGREIVAGETLTVDCDPLLCRRGLHASEDIRDALGYAQGPVVCRVEVGGTIVRGDDKLVGTERKTLWALDATELLHEFACLCAEDALALVEDPDPRSLAAIETKRRWVRGEVTDKDWAEAWIAAQAARRAVLSTHAANSAAAWAIAENAVAAASWAALRAASEGDWYANRAAQSKRLLDMVEAERRAT